MSVHQKVDGAWVTANRPHVKRSNTWVPAKEVWVKRSGVWVRAYEYDVAPPPAPLLSLEIVETRYGAKNALQGEHIRVGARIPGPQNNEVRLIRVLTTYGGKAPTTQFGGTYTSAPSDGWPNEPWSDFRYTGGNSTVDYRRKNWPRNAAPSNQLVSGQTYYFTAWAQDDAGNWSAGTAAAITAPKKGTNFPNIVVKEGRFNAIWSGSFIGTASGAFAPGEMIQRSSPMSRGVLGYGNQVVNAIGQQGAPTIRNAQIYLLRGNDTGSATANIYMGWHGHNSTSDVSPIDLKEVIKLGTLSKGEGKWFTVPEQHWDNLNAGLYGFGFFFKDPVKAAADASDFSALKSVTDNPRNGELHVVWQENL